MAFRAQQMDMLREQSRRLAKRSAELLEAAAPHSRQVLRAAGRTGPNLGLLEWCLNQIRWPDSELIRHLQHGFPLVGHIPADVEAPPSLVRSSSLSISELKEKGRKSWARQLRRHSETSSDFDADIYCQTLDEVQLGRMTVPVPAVSQEPSVVTRRFGVSQVDSKGVSKVRCIDDFKESMVNDACAVARKIRMGRISDLEFVARTLAAVGEATCPAQIGLQGSLSFASDRDFHLDLARVIFRDFNGAVWSSTQLAMPFGGVASVFSWDRLGAALAALAAILQELLLILSPRYVDDLFWTDFLRAAAEGRLAAMELVTLLGFTLEERKTPMPALCQDILGVRVSLCADGSGLQFAAETRKAKIWSQEITETLSAPQVDFPRFRKLVGRLSFAGWATWGQVSRCHVVGLHRQIRKWSSTLMLRTIVDLHWWSDHINKLSVRLVPFCLATTEPILMYTDACGRGGLGAVCVTSSSKWVSGQVPSGITQRLKRRRTQICIFETLVVICASRIFVSQIRGRRVVFFIDNLSALGALRRGCSSAWDMCALVEMFWEHAVTHGIIPIFRYVPSKLNLADPPSRRRAASLGDQLPWRPRFDSILKASDLAVSRQLGLPPE